MSVTEYKSLIGGEWIVGNDAGSQNVNPSDTSDILGEATGLDQGQIANVVEVAKQASSVWGKSTPQQRFDALDFIGTEILARQKELGELLSREEGKTLGEGIGEVARAGFIFKFFAGEALRLNGDIVASVRPGVEVDVQRHAMGVVALIAPWNFPIAIPAWKTAPALAYGNAVILKPAELVPGCSFAMAEIISRSGLPDGTFNLVYGRGSKIGPALIESSDVNAVSFTGSVPTGRGIAADCGRLLKKVQLEMGGKNPLVVLDDADLSTAVEAAVNGAFFSTGQRCTASSRLIVTEGIHDKFVSALKERLNGLNIDNALKAGTHIGPVVDETQLQQDLDYVEIAKKEGGDVVGGERLTRETNGFYMQPALITETTNNMRINQIGRASCRERV